MKDKNNHRKFPRIDKKWKINYQPITLEDYPIPADNGSTIDISDGGVCFTSNEEIQSGTVIALEVYPDDSPSAVIVLARVVWCRTNLEDNTYEIGAEFMKPELKTPSHAPRLLLD